MGRVRRASISNVPGLLKVTVEPAAAVAPIFNVMILVKTARSSSISGADPADMTPLSQSQYHLEEDFFKEEFSAKMVGSPIGVLAIGTMMVLLVGMCAGKHDAKTVQIAPGVDMPYINLGGVTKAPSNCT
jgi:hypothetical protein